MIKRFKFSDIFQENPDGSLSLKKVISVNGVTFGFGVTFTSGVAFGGINFYQYKYLDIAAEEQSDGVLVIKGFYKN